MSVQPIPVLERSQRSTQAGPLIEYYYDSHSTKEDLMGDNRVHVVPIKRTDDLTSYLFREQGYFIAFNLNHYTSRFREEYPVAPDIAVFKDVFTAQLPASVPSWIVGDWNPYTKGRVIPPTLVIEVASKETWQADIEDKPAKYAQMGVKEYYFFCPVDAPVPRRIKKIPIRAWTSENGIAIERSSEADNHPRGWIWSEELDSYLAAEGNYLQLYDRYGSKRLTGEEAAQQAAEQERAAREQERAAKEAALQSAAEEREAMERLLAKLREKGIDPDSL